MRVGFVSDKDPLDRWSWSGTIYSMYAALQRQSCDVVHIGKGLLPIGARLPKPLRQIARQLAKPALVDRDESSARRIAEVLDREVAASGCDVLFAPIAPFGYMETRLPIVYTSDTTFRLLESTYASVRNLPAEQRAYAEASERRRVDRADVLLYPSQCVADSAIEHYGADPSRVHLVPYGASVEDIPDIDQVLQARTADVCRLLFIGKDWERKGGEIAVDCLRSLCEKGRSAELIIVGNAPETLKSEPNVRYIGLLNKNKPEQRALLNALLCESHFMFVPSRAEAYGVVFCEGNAFGLPAITTDVGGIPSIVRDGVNGRLLPLEASGDAYAETVAKIFWEENSYEAFARSSRCEYDARLNWDAWAKAASHVLRDALLFKRQGKSAADRGHASRLHTD